MPPISAPAPVPPPTATAVRLPLPLTVTRIVRGLQSCRRAPYVDRGQGDCQVTPSPLNFPGDLDSTTVPVTPAPDGIATSPCTATERARVPVKVSPSWAVLVSRVLPMTNHNAGARRNHDRRWWRGRGCRGRRLGHLLVLARAPSADPVQEPSADLARAPSGRLQAG